MPIVPKINPEVAPVALPGVRQPLDTGAGAEGEALGQGLARLSSTLDRYAEQKSEEADGVAVTEALAKLSTGTTALVSATQKSRGRDAVGATDKALASWDKEADQIRGGLATERQARAFERIAASRRADVYGSLLRWEDSEVERWSDETADSAVSAAIERTRALGPQPESIAGALEEIRALRATQSQRKRWDPETLRMVTLRDTSQLHALLLDGFGPEQIEDARAYYDEHKDDMLAVDRNKVEAWLEKAGQEAEAVTAADRILAQAGEDRAKAYQLTAQLNPTLRVDTEQRLDALYQRQDQLDDDAKREAWAEAQEAFKAGNYRLAAVPVKIRARLPATGAFSEEQLLHAERAFHDPRPVDPYVGLAAYARWANLSDQDKAAVDPLVFLGRNVPPELLRSAITERGNLLNPPEKGVSFAAVRQRAAAAAAALGAFRGLTRDEEQIAQGQLSQFLLEKLQGHEDEKGNYAPEAAQSAVDEATIHGRLDRGWFLPDPKKFRFQVPGTSLDSFYTDGTTPFVPRPGETNRHSSTSGRTFSQFYQSLRNGTDLPENPADAPFDAAALFRAGVQPLRQPDGSIDVPNVFRRAPGQHPDDPPPELRAKFEAALKARGLIADDRTIQESYQAWLRGGE